MSSGRNKVMKIVCDKSELLKSINISLKAVPVRSTIPVLECILISAGPAGIVFTTNDTELGIETYVKGEVLEPGVIAVQAKMFSEIARKLPMDEVIITSDENYNITIVSGKARFAIGGQSGEDFAYLPQVERDDSIMLSQFTLRNVIQQTIFSIAAGDNNRIMSGEFFEISDTGLRVIALDGHRIAIRHIDLPGSYPHITAIVPGKALTEISKIFTGDLDDMVNIYFTKSHIMLEIPGTTIVSRLIEGQYFNVDQMISSDYATKVRINNRTLVSCVDRATLFVREGDKKPIILDFDDVHMNISIASPMGSMNEDVDIEKEGRDLAIGFNPRFLIDALRAISDEEINMYFTNAKSPCFIRDDEGTYTYLILPVNFTR